MSSTSRSARTKTSASSASRTSSSEVFPPGTGTSRPSRWTATGPSTEISNTSRVYGGVSARCQRRSGWSPHAALPPRAADPPTRGRRRRRDLRDRRRLADQRRPDDPRRGRALRARRRGPGRPRPRDRGDDARPPARRHRRRPSRRGPRAGRRARPRPPRRPPRQRPRRVDRRREPFQQGAHMSKKRTASLLILAAVLANVGFTALGSIFNYPDVLDEPAGKVLAAFRDEQGAVSAWFCVLAFSAALLAPIAVGVGRLSGHRAMRIAVPVGIAASVVQVIGLLRWPILVPGYAADGNTGAFRAASDVLGTALGETVGYLLTATWTLLVIVALGRRYAGRWFQVLGGVSAILVLAGVLSPLDLPGLDTANFFGYVLWSLWLIAFAVVVLVHERRVTTPSTLSPSGVTT